MIDYAAARRAMVENQLRPSRIADPGVLEAMGEVPREMFLPARLRGVAYFDEDVELGDGRYLIEPLALARMVQAAMPDPTGAALVIGCATGYCSAVMARLAGTVFHLAWDDEQVAAVERNLGAIECDNVIVTGGNVAAGLAEQAPFNAILLGGSVRDFPPALIDQLENGGRAVAVLRRGRAGQVTVAHRVGDAIGRLSLDSTAIPPLQGEPAELAFQF